MNNLEIVKFVMDQDVGNLRDIPYVENLICQAGLHNDDRICGNYGVDSRFIRSYGMLQQPRQLAEALVFLSKHEIRRYVEIGTFYGAGTCFMSAYFTKFEHDFECITVDTDKGIGTGEIGLIKGMGVSIRQVRGTSNDIKGTESDLCFIDGNHDYEWVVKDYENVGKYSRIAMFHDIQDEWAVEQGLCDGGSMKHWKELKKTYPNRRFYEFTYHPEGKKFFGIGVMI